MLRRKVCLPILIPVFLAGCGNDGSSPTEVPDPEESPMIDVAADGIPRFVQTDYIDLSKVGSITRFRSAQGHDYSDEFETCRSMKHYYRPIWVPDEPDLAIGVFAPVTGTVSWKEGEWAGVQIHIQSEEHPAINFMIFHIDLEQALDVGDRVVEGQLLGQHIGNVTWSDIGVRIHTAPEGRTKYVSYFETMTDSLFATLQARGVASRSDFVISKEERDADPLTCNGLDFLTFGSGVLEDWVYLN